MNHSDPGRMPVLFVGHGSPMNAIQDNRWSRAWAELGASLPRPTAILAISAHWFVDGTFVTGNEWPRTIHDFGGFSRALYEIDYPAPGSVDLANRVREVLGEQRADARDDWGLDHGTWSVVRWMFPDADIPIVQLSIDRRLDVRRHYQLARPLGVLRDEGVLVLGSGNVVHNLRDAAQHMQSGSTKTPGWAARHDEVVASAVTEHDVETLLSIWPDTEDGRLSHPNPDHWLPLIYTQAAADPDDSVQFPTDGFDWGSISMRSILYGG